MTDDQHGDQQGEGTPPSGGRWDPLPQGDYDDGATAFVKLPEGGVDALFASADSPLAAPGHGYVPPQITVAPATGTDPAATGTWAMPSAPVDGTQWHVPETGQEQAAHQGYAAYPQQDTFGGAAPYDAHAGQGDPAQDDRFTYRPGATGQWDFSEAAAGAEDAGRAPGQDVTGQWSIPVADGDLPDESGEFTTSSLAEQWGGTAPATLPGGAPAPWATQSAGQPWGDREAESVPGVGPNAVPDAGPYPEAPAEPAEPAVEAGSAAPTAEGAVTGELQGAEEAPEGPAEAPADAAEDVEAEAAPQAPEEPLAGPAPVVEEEPGPQDPEPDAEPRTDLEAVPEAAPGTAPETDAAAPAADAQEQPPAGPHEEHPLASYVLRVNGTDRPVTDAWIGESLLYVLRERLGLAGAKDGCSQGECGACNVQVDGRLVASCLVPAVTSAGSEVRTVEGLAADGQPSDVQRALARRGAVQCGFCVPGMAMTVHNLLEGNPAPTELEARQALCGNLCRCSGYRGVLEAVQEVVAEREAHAATDTPEADADELRIPHQAGPGAGGVNPSAFETPFESPGPPDRPYGDQPHGDQPHGQDGGHA
ncbi:2Fe-2S iron-sulfur cluster-binding protein [Streptomyces sp. NPDC053750]|uniref:2Fe-2S iron-sulfur cluster-binding protein n=1 Tax=Streptomyces sp. NPDC053750 TaxID=3365714 RepID=UPI0037D7A00F